MIKNNKKLNYLIVLGVLAIIAYMVFAPNKYERTVKEHILTNKSDFIINTTKVINNEAYMKTAFGDTAESTIEYTVTQLSRAYFITNKMVNDYNMETEQDLDPTGTKYNLFRINKRLAKDLIEETADVTGEGPEGPIVWCLSKYEEMGADIEMKIIEGSKNELGGVNGKLRVYEKDEKGKTYGQYLEWNVSYSKSSDGSMFVHIDKPKAYDYDAEVKTGVKTPVYKSKSNGDDNTYNLISHYFELIRWYNSEKGSGYPYGPHDNFKKAPKFI